MSLPRKKSTRPGLWMGLSVTGMRTLSIPTLILRARAGDSRAFQELCRSFRHSALGYAGAILRDEHLAEDAVQEAFLECYHRLSELRQPAAFSAWLRRIVFKHCDRIRRRKTPQPAEQLPAVPEKESNGPHEIVWRKELADRMGETLAELPPAERRLAELRFLRGYSYRQIALELELPEHGVKNRLRVLRQTLRKGLGDLTNCAVPLARTSAIYGHARPGNSCSWAA